MSTTTNLALITPDNQKNIMQILQIVENVLKELIAEAKKEVPTNLSLSQSFRINRSPSFDISPSNQYLRAFFTLRENQRMLSISFDCDTDLKRISDQPKIIFSLGFDDQAQEILRAIAVQLIEEYPDQEVFLEPNDSKPVWYQLNPKYQDK